MAGLFLLLLAIVGPWYYDSDGVPPAEWCKPPFILLTIDRCMQLVSGLKALPYMFASLLRIPKLILTMKIPSAYSFPYAGMILLPLFTTSLNIFWKETTFLRIFDGILWGMGAYSAYKVVFSISVFGVWRLWGFCLFMGLAAVMLALDFFLILSARVNFIDWWRSAKESRS